MKLDVKELKKKIFIVFEETDTSIRTFNALRRSGIHTLGQLTELTEDELKKIRN